MIWNEIRTIKDFNQYVKHCTCDELIELAREYVAINNMATIPESFRIRQLMDLPAEQDNEDRQIQIFMTISDECTRRYAETETFHRYINDDYYF